MLKMFSVEIPNFSNSKGKDVFAINDPSSKLQSKKEELILKQMLMKFYNLEMLQLSIPWSQQQRQQMKI